ncbi:MAG TPA: Xaa-Pro peptidase family protein [Bacillota bacterium]
MPNFTQEEFDARIFKLQQLMAEKGVDLAVLDQNSDLYYFTGSVLPQYLVVPAVGKPVLLARKAVERIKAEVPQLSLEYFQNTKELRQIIDDCGFLRAERVGFTLEKTAYVIVERWLQLLSGAAAVEISAAVRQLRMVKSQRELEIISAAGRIIAGIPQVVRERFRPGMTELELSVAVENYLRIHGHSGFLRVRRETVEIGNGVCSAGTNALAGTKFEGICGGVGLSQANPFGAADRKIPYGQPVILDYGLNYQGYHVDLTRMFCWGLPTPEVFRAFQVMLEIEQTLMEELRPGRLGSELYAAAVQLAADYGYEKEFMGLGPEKVRFVGHGIGLELDELPLLAPKMDYPVVAGMTIALEPKVALPGLGVIGNEDTVVVREDGCECLTMAAPEMIIVE